VSPDEVAKLVEFTEADAYLSIYQAAPPDVAERLCIKTARFGRARARLIGSVNFTLFNAVVGLGVGEDATEQALDDIIEFYRPHGVSFMIQVSPLARPTQLPAWLEARGFRYRDDWVKGYMGAGSPPPAATTDLQIREVRPEQADAFADTILKGFEFPPAATVLTSLITAGVGRPGWRHYLAYDGETPVATGGLYVTNGVGWLGYGSTSPSHRRRGAQGAMFARRIRDAADMGCKWLVTETDAETPERPSPSYRNMARSGFVIAYSRPNYVWRPDSSEQAM
jgi:hypothetical protein